jgi:hypothetical protein
MFLGKDLLYFKNTSLDSHKSDYNDRLKGLFTFTEGNIIVFFIAFIMLLAQIYHSDH